MKRAMLIIVFFVVCSSLFAQNENPATDDSLRAVLEKTGEDSIRVRTLLELGAFYYFRQPDSSLLYSTKAVELSRKLDLPRQTQQGMLQQAETLNFKGDFIQALKVGFDWLSYSQKVENKFYESLAFGFIGVYYSALEDYDHAIEYLKKALTMRRLETKGPVDGLFHLSLAEAYSLTQRNDSAFFHYKETRRILEMHKNQFLQAAEYISLGNAFMRIGNLDSADFYFRASLSEKHLNPNEMPLHYSGIMQARAALFELQNELDSGVYLARKAIRVAQNKHLNAQIYGSSSLLAKLYKKQGKRDSVIHYQDLAISTYDSIYGKRKYTDLQLVLLQEQRRNQEIQQEGERNRNRFFLFGLSLIITVILIASMLLLINYRKKQRANLALERTLSELKSTQSQLIQSEKMASLGELTAGIAHEIQNPLNFVNNFSEVNAELLLELDQQIENRNFDEVKEIAKNVIHNQEKINQHGKRADGIVKSMLQHSRSSSGQKEMTDINALCDECLRLTYHGFRAKDKLFNAKLNSNLDPSLPSVNVVPQEIGRVLLNLINNAFYAVNEKAKINTSEYVPTVTVATKRLNSNIEICVQDNGNGIPGAIKEKIFQPFFTTKPTGQGTGLGLSLAYEIVNKVHGGEISVETKEGEGSQFIIHLPVVHS